MEYYSTMERKKPLVHGGKAIEDLKCILLNERSQCEKAAYYMILTI